MTGMIAATGSPQSGPMRIGVPLVDISTGLYAAIGILMALSERQKSGVGQFLETTLYETGLAIMHPHAANYFMHGKPPQLTGNEHPNLVPYAIFPTRTAISLSASAMTAPSASSARRSASLNSAAICVLRATRTASPTARRCVPSFRRVQSARRRAALRPPAGRGSAGRAGAGDRHGADQCPHRPPRRRHRKGLVQGGRSPIRLERTKARLRNVPPKFSEHATDVLTEFGYSRGEIEALIAKGVVCGPERKR